MQGMCPEATWHCAWGRWLPRVRHRLVRGGPSRPAKGAVFHKVPARGPPHTQMLCVPMASGWSTCQCCTGTRVVKVGLGPREGSAAAGSQKLCSRCSELGKLWSKEGREGVENGDMVGVEVWSGLGQIKTTSHATSTRPSGSTASTNTLRWARPSCRWESDQSSRVRPPRHPR